MLRKKVNSPTPWDLRYENIKDSPREHGTPYQHEQAPVHGTYGGPAVVAADRAGRGRKRAGRGDYRCRCRRNCGSTGSQRCRCLLCAGGSRGHVGGRAWTDTSTFGVPFDVGAHWVSTPSRSARLNPYYTRGKESDYRFYRAPDAYRVFTEEREANSSETEALWQTYGDMRRRIGEAGDSSRDVAPASVVAESGEWRNTAGFLLGPWDMAKDLDSFSCLDWWHSEDLDDWYCAQGYGTLVADHLGDIPVTLDTRVRKIDWKGSGVKVDTSQGKSGHGP